MLRAALVIVDLQEDFLPPNGSLAVPNGRDVIDKIVNLCDLSKYHWQAIVATKDWHPANHTLFASNHRVPPFTDLNFEHPLKEKNARTGEVKYKVQTVWPDHCVQDTPGSNIEKLVQLAFDQLPKSFPKIVVQKGYLQDRDYYLCFGDVWKSEKTELEDFLLENEISHVVVVGLAYDYCVLNSAIDSAMSGFSTAVLRDCCRSVYPERNTATEKFYRDASVLVFETIDDYLQSLKDYSI